jgi:hypothetical protein
MKLAAADAIAACVPEEAIGPEYIIPSVFQPEVATRSPPLWRPLLSPTASSGATSEGIRSHGGRKMFLG